MNVNGSLFQRAADNNKNHESAWFPRLCVSVKKKLLAVVLQKR